MQSLQQRLTKLEEEIARFHAKTKDKPVDYSEDIKAVSDELKELRRELSNKKEVDIVAEIERIVDIKYINNLYGLASQGSIKSTNNKSITANDVKGIVNSILSSVPSMDKEARDKEIKKTINVEYINSLYKGNK